jgi:hypothetical protein
VILPRLVFPAEKYSYWSCFQQLTEGELSLSTTRGLGVDKLIEGLNLNHVFSSRCSCMHAMQSMCGRATAIPPSSSNCHTIKLPSYSYHTIELPGDQATTKPSNCQAIKLPSHQATALPSSCQAIKQLLNHQAAK